MHGHERSRPRFSKRAGSDLNYPWNFLLSSRPQTLIVETFVNEDINLVGQEEAMFDIQNVQAVSRFSLWAPWINHSTGYNLVSTNCALNFWLSLMNIHKL